MIETAEEWVDANRNWTGGLHASRFDTAWGRIPGLHCKWLISHVVDLCLVVVVPVCPKWLLSLLFQIICPLWQKCVQSYPHKSVHHEIGMSTFSCIGCIFVHLKIHYLREGNSNWHEPSPTCDGYNGRRVDGLHLVQAHCRLPHTAWLPVIAIELTIFRAAQQNTHSRPPTQL